MRPALLALSCLLPACTYFSGDSRVLVASDPPGAAIWIDGEDTGRTTPTMVDLGGILGADHVVEVRKSGFEPEQRLVSHYTTFRTSRWIDGADLVTWSAPLWWTLGDWFTPFAVDWQYVPHELLVRLYRSGEAPVRQTAR